MPIISTADEATAREVYDRSGLTPQQLVGNRNAAGETPTTHDAYRHINRSILSNVIAEVELDAATLAGGLGFPLSDATIADAEPDWDSEQRAEYAANLLLLLREWTIWLGVAAARASAKRPAGDSQEGDQKMEFAISRAAAIRATLATALQRIAARTVIGGDAQITEVPRSYSARVVSAF